MGIRVNFYPQIFMQWNVIFVTWVKFKYNCQLNWFVEFTIIQSLLIPLILIIEELSQRHFRNPCTLFLQVDVCAGYSFQYSFEFSITSALTLLKYISTLSCAKALFDVLHFLTLQQITMNTHVVLMGLCLLK